MKLAGGQFLRLPLLILGCVASSLLGAVAIGVAPPFLLWPRFALMLAFHILGAASFGIEMLLILAVGLLQDILLGNVIGSGVLALLAGHALFRGTIASLKKSGVPGYFLLFVPFLIVVLTIEWVLSSLAGLMILPTDGLIWQIVVTSVIYLAVMSIWSGYRHWRRSRYSARARLS